MQKNTNQKLLELLQFNQHMDDPVYLSCHIAISLFSVWYITSLYWCFQTIPSTLLGPLPHALHLSPSPNTAYWFTVVAFSFRMNIPPATSSECIYLFIFSPYDHHELSYTYQTTRCSFIGTITHDKTMQQYIGMTVYCFFFFAAEISTSIR